MQVYILYICRKSKSDGAVLRTTDNRNVEFVDKRFTYFYFVSKHNNVSDCSQSIAFCVDVIILVSEKRADLTICIVIHRLFIDSVHVSIYVHSFFLLVLGNG